MRVVELMKRDPEWLTVHATCRDAARRMRDANIGFLPVCDRDAHVLGTITDRDITIRLVAEAKEADLPVSDVMTREIVSCHADDDLSRAEQIMATSQKSRLVVVDEDDRLVGVLSLSDVVEHDREHAAETVARVAAREAAVPLPH